MSEHSPEPWFSRGSEVYDNNGQVIGESTAGMFALEEANARLMAAAPELLAALDAFLSITSYCGKEHCTAEQCVAALNAIKALSKARGES